MTRLTAIKLRALRFVEYWGEVDDTASGLESQAHGLKLDGLVRIVTAPISSLGVYYTTKVSLTEAGERELRKHANEEVPDAPE